MQQKAFAFLRIVFGVVWAVDAWFKWQPEFASGFISYFTSAAQGQPALIASWITWWVHIVSPHPSAWALFIACCETAIAVGLLFGVLTRTAIVGGAVLALLIWMIPQAFGMPFMSGTTDVGAGIIYVLLFIALWFGQCWKAYSIDRLLTK